MATPGFPMWTTSSYGRLSLGPSLVLHAQDGTQSAFCLETGRFTRRTLAPGRVVSVGTDGWFVQAGTSTRSSTWRYVQGDGQVRWERSWEMGEDLSRLGPGALPWSIGAFVMASRDWGRGLVRVSETDGSWQLLTPIGGVRSVQRLGQGFVGLDTRRRSQPARLWRFDGSQATHRPLDCHYTSLQVMEERLYASQESRGWVELSADGAVLHHFGGHAASRLGLAQDGEVIVPYQDRVTCYDGSYRPIWTWRCPCGHYPTDLDRIDEHVALLLEDGWVLDAADGSAVASMPGVGAMLGRHTVAGPKAVLWANDQTIQRVL